MTDKIVLNKALGTYDVTKINSNFDKIAEHLNEKVLYRKNPSGTANTLDSDIDANGKRIINLPAPVLGHEPARKMDLPPLEAVNGALAQLNTALTNSGDLNAKVAAATQAAQNVAHLNDAVTTLVEIADTTEEAFAVIQGRFAEIASVRDFGAKGDGVTNDTAAIQSAIDSVFSKGGGAVLVPSGNYLISASTLAETYDNAGVPIAASLCGVVLRKGVSLIGTGPVSCKLFTTNEELLVIGMVAPEGNQVEGIDIGSTWVPGDTGAGHGIFVLASTGGADNSCKNVLFRNLRIHNVGSYAIGLQSGSPTNCRIDSVTVDTVGADGLDLKARSDFSTEPSGNHCTNVTVRSHGMRVTGSAGVDVRGIWHLSNITVTDFGGDASKDFFGIRFRTKPAPTDAYNKAGARSSLSGFYVRATSGAAAVAIYGITSGSDDVHVSNGVVDSCTIGVIVTGNANGSANRNVFHNVTCINSVTYGFQTINGSLSSIFNTCTSVSSGTAGFRNEAERTTFIGCVSANEAVPTSTASPAFPTEVMVGNTFTFESGVSMYSVAAGRVNIDAKGTSANIDIQFAPKGTGRLRFGTYTASADAPVTGYIEIRDTGGTVRKLAIIT
jgi:hypothetical protein